MGILSFLRTESWWNGIKGIFSRSNKISSSVLDEIEELLITSDVGLDTTSKLVEALKSKVKGENIDSSELYQLLVQEIRTIMTSNKIAKKTHNTDKPHVIMMVGVNGAGKTTTIAKLANMYKREKKTVLVGACDTFRAAAVDQLQIWCNRVGVEIVKSENKAPSTVAYETVSTAKNSNKDIVIIDTAGRLQNNTGLMEELNKIKRVICKLVEENDLEVLLVLDASIGQNSFDQLRAFNEKIHVDGLILTKLDGISKGGFIIGLTNEFHIPIRYVGTGEKVNDISIFDTEEYLKTFIEY